MSSRISEPVLPWITSPTWLPEGWPAGGSILCISENPSATRRELLPLLEPLGCLIEVREATADSPVVLPPGEQYRLLVFDILHTDGPGFRLCEEARTASTTPMLLLLRGAAREDVLHAYQAGADAHVICPFDPREFQARLYAILRRSGSWVS